MRFISFIMFMREKCKSITMTVLYHTFHTQMYIYSAVMWLRKDFDPFIALYPYFDKKTTFRNISFITTKLNLISLLLSKESI